MELKEMQANAEVASQLLKSMANPKRLMLLCHLVQGEYSVGELESRIGLSQSALSQHLSRLRREGIVQCRREAQNIYYSLKGEQARELLQALYGIFCSSETPAPSGDKLTK